jgi:hypothetical protein
MLANNARGDLLEAKSRCIPLADLGQDYNGFPYPGKGCAMSAHGTGVGVGMSAFRESIGG